MKIKPIIFNTGMVRAELEGKKTATRRICKDVNEYCIPDMSFYDPDKRTYAVHSYADLEHTDKLSIAERRCPICPGDILYVRETWAFIPCISCSGEYARELHSCYDFQAVEYDDGESISDGCFVYRADCKTPERIIWRPSIHMPKQAARIWLKVTDVRVERLQDMTEDQAIKEGISCVKYDVNTGKEESAALDWFPILWDSTVKKSDSDRYGWDANPWVWVIEFKQCEKPEERL